MASVSHSTLLFAKHLSSAAKVCLERDKAKESLNAHLHKMRKSIISMTLSYSDIDRLKAKTEALVKSEREYAKFFRVPDDEVVNLKEYTAELEEELRNERLEKQRIIEENSEKIAKLSESLDSIKNHTKFLLMEKAKKHNRMLALEKKIREKVDVHSYYRHRH